MVNQLKFAVASALLDACVLGVLSNEPDYGYDLTQKIQETIDVSVLLFIRYCDGY